MKWKTTREPFAPDPTDLPVADQDGQRYWLRPGAGELPARMDLFADAGEPAGFVELEWDSRTVIENFGILIDPPFRRRGLASAVMRTLIEWARLRAVTLIQGYVRETDLAAQPFLLDWYAHLGFTVAPAAHVSLAATLALRPVNLDDPHW